VLRHSGGGSLDVGLKSRLRKWKLIAEYNLDLEHGETVTPAVDPSPSPSHSF